MFPKIGFNVLYRIAGRDAQPAGNGPRMARRHRRRQRPGGRATAPQRARRNDQVERDAAPRSEASTPPTREPRRFPVCRDERNRGPMRGFGRSTATLHHPPRSERTSPRSFFIECCAPPQRSSAACQAPSLGQAETRQAADIRTRRDVLRWHGPGLRALNRRRECGAAVPRFA